MISRSSCAVVHPGSGKSDDGSVVWDEASGAGRGLDHDDDEEEACSVRRRTGAWCVTEYTCKPKYRSSDGGYLEQTWSTVAEKSEGSSAFYASRINSETVVRGQAFWPLRLTSRLLDLLQDHWRRERPLGSGLPAESLLKPGLPSVPGQCGQRILNL